MNINNILNFNTYVIHIGSFLQNRRNRQGKNRN